jgi:hypothetical protein
MKAKGSWAWVCDTHEPVRTALAPYRGTVLPARKLKDLIRGIPGIGNKGDLIHPSDHCANMNNVAACDCAETDPALVKRIRRGWFLVL